MKLTPDTPHNDTRDSLLNELESIRSLLKEHSEDNQPRLQKNEPHTDAAIPVLSDSIPVLQEAIPVLQDKIPVLDTRHFTPSAPEPTVHRADAQLASVRAAAAMVAAKAIRHRNNETPSVTTPATTGRPSFPLGNSPGDDEKLITAVIEELRPQLEALLRNTLRKHLTAPRNNPKGNP